MNRWFSWFACRQIATNLSCKPWVVKVTLALCSLNILCISEARASLWLTEPSINTSVQYNDNQLLSTRSDDESSETPQQIETSKVILSPLFKLSYRAPRTELISSARLRASRYNKQIFDSDDWYGDVLLRKKSELSQVELAVNYAYDSTLVSEIEDTGLIQDNKRRRRFSISPSWQHQINFNNLISVTYSFEDVSYREGESSGLFAYDNQAVSTHLLHQLDAKASTGMVLYASRFNSPSRGSEFKNIGIQGSYEYKLTEIMKLGLGAGVRQTDSRLNVISGKIENSNIGNTFSALLTQSWQRTSFEVSLQRSIEPSGSGYAVLRDQANVTLKQQLTEKWVASFFLRGFRNKSLRDEITGIDRNYISLDSRLSWRWNRNITLSALYRYRQQKYDVRVDTARGNSVEASLTYRWVR